ncbi:TetR/AcrR family transcriptional regulator [Sphingomonas sp. FW199]|uniref:TetR/AcrR family transcriptional regulator n=1 Tax=Sphingomonas sp. FW199 TaxID=3400217 RepID=UPI003CE83081
MRNRGSGVDSIGERQRLVFGTTLIDRCIAASSAANDLHTGRNAVGRPRDPAKHDAIIGAAREAFFERGFNAATIEDIAQRAGVSKVTIYKQFSDKETLFESVIKAETERMAAGFVGPVETGDQLIDRLNSFGLLLLSFLFHPDHVTLDRVLAPELTQMPDLARRFFDAGPAQCRMALGNMIVEADQRGMLKVEDPMFAAETLLAMWKGFLDIELRFQVTQHQTEEQLKARVNRGTQLFLRLFSAKPNTDIGDGS